MGRGKEAGFRRRNSGFRVGGRSFPAYLFHLEWPRRPLAEALRFSPNPESRTPNPAFYHSHRQRSPTPVFRLIE